jgi:hypothetical protein
MPEKSVRIARDAGMIAVIAAVSGQIEGDGQAFLAGGDVATVECVRIFGGGETGILADGPRLGDVHRRIWAAQVGCDPGVGVEEIEAIGVSAGIYGFHLDPFGRCPRLCGRSGGWNRGWRGCFAQWQGGEVRNPGHKRSQSGAAQDPGLKSNHHCGAS